MCLLKQYEQVAITDITKQLQDAGLFNKPGILQTVWVLHGLIDKDEKVEVDGEKHKRGATRPVAQETIANMIGVSRRQTAHGYLKELIDAGILRAEQSSFQGKKCYRYIFTIFDKYAEKSAQQEKSAPDNDESPPKSPQAAGHRQEYQDTSNNPPSESNVSRDTEPDEKRGDFSNQEEERDIAPNREIGEFLDSLTKDKGMAKGENGDVDENLEAFMNVFKPLDGIVWTWKDQQPASQLRERIINMLSAAAVEMPPNLFFQRCIEEMDSRVMDGKIDVRPSSFNYFLNAATGKDILDFTLEKLKSENSAASNLEKTNNYLADLRARSKAPVEIPADARKALDAIYGRS